LGARGDAAQDRHPQALNSPMTSGELSQKTGCVGGQLYHHLANLENAGLIAKEGDRYAVKEMAMGKLLGLATVTGGLPMAKNG
jgi:hypothetical protein